ncbi:hypothetical protein [Cognatilysobacter lacus]|uniref:Cell surface protein n=1 Tax=Cognatilysobacter lacus TaxID=1643323 RepID=A0A5D8YZJ5_9GAMM|nr:hypothetical protein [Lysobacter lacus]TZF87263.1 hypothetical protein FW784_11380 [Lysobacter lacus]
MKVQMTVLALTLAACCGTAFAQDDSATNTKTYITNLIDVAGKVRVEGTIKVDSEAAANVDQDQYTVGNRSIGDGDHTARMTDNALRNSRGNIGVNVSAGVGNAQSNDAAITTLASSGKKDDGDKHSDGGGKSAASALSHAMVFSTQASLGNYATTHTYDTNYRATLDGDALRDVIGNVGVNVAAGVGNAQSNGMSASVADASIAKSSSDSEQLSLLNELNSACGDLDVVARFGDNALQAASGNIGVNVAAGVGNLQHNGLAIAAAGGGGG